MKNTQARSRITTGLKIAIPIIGHQEAQQNQGEAVHDPHQLLIFHTTNDGYYPHNFAHITRFGVLGWVLISISGIVLINPLYLT